jgi:hypothetical protein
VMSNNKNTRIDLAIFMQEFWFVLIPLVLLICVGAAFAVDCVLKYFNRPSNP